MGSGFHVTIETHSFDFNDQMLSTFERIARGIDPEVRFEHLESANFARPGSVTFQPDLEPADLDRLAAVFKDSDLAARFKANLDRDIGQFGQRVDPITKQPIVFTSLDATN